MRTRLVVLACLTALVSPAVVGWFSARPDAPALYAAEADPTDLKPGLSLTIETGSGAQKDSRAARLVSLRVPAGATPTPFLPAGPFKATWEGFIKMRLRDEMTFKAKGRGKLQVELNGELVLETAGEDLSINKSNEIKLKKGLNALKVTYASSESGEATMRLGTVRKDDSWDPISPNLLQHDASEAFLKQRTVLRDGRALLADLRCLNCHSPDDALKAAPDVMPELKQDAPSLTDAGDRFNVDWLAHWINNPKSLRKTAHMPRLFHAGAIGEMDPRAADIAAYVATLKATVGGDDEPVPGDESFIASGARLFAGLGCIGCHTTPDQAELAPDESRTPLRHVKAKYKPAALRGFLKKPEAHYAWTRMPNFNLSDDEATHLTAYLLHHAPDDAMPKLAGEGDAERGKALFDSAGCLSCHVAPGKNALEPPLLATIAETHLDQGCLAETNAARGKAPDFDLQTFERAKIATAIKTSIDSLAHDTRAEFAERQVHALNCVACHVRDGVPDIWAGLTEEASKITAGLPPVEESIVGDQSRPDLTWAGEKLRPQWMGSFIAGEVDYKPRPWLKARMPSFASRAKLIAEGFALQHAFPTEPAPLPPSDPQQAELGRKLVGRQGGFSCIQCHAVVDMKAFGAFEAQAINFMYTSDRMNHDYFHRWVRDPQRYQPGTRMPQYADNSGKTPYKDVLEGDAHKQFEAIWQYLLQGHKMNPPE